LALQIRREDPDLYALLSNNAGAALRASALDNSLSPVKPDPQKDAEQARQGRLQELFDLKPFAEESWNMSAQLEMAMLDPKLAAELKEKAANPVQQDALTNAQARRAEKETNDLRVASLNSGTAQAGAQYNRLKFLRQRRQFQSPSAS
jgi:hypothetical protein